MNIPWQVTASFFSGLVLIYLIILAKNGKNKIDLLDLVTHSGSGRLDYKRVALNCCALLQSFTWFRMSMGYEINPALHEPFMWIVFYAVIAGHDLLARVVEIRKGNLNNANSSTDVERN